MKHSYSEDFAETIASTLALIWHVPHAHDEISTAGPQYTSLGECKTTG